MSPYRGVPSFTDHGPYPAKVDFPGIGYRRVCRACSYSDDGTPLTAVRWPCEHAAPQDGQLLAAAVTARRDQLGYSPRQLAALAGISLHTLRAVEGAKSDEPQDTTLTGLERALRWTPGSAVRVLTGGHPTPLVDPLSVEVPAEVEVVLRENLPDEVEHALLAHVAERRRSVEAALREEAVMLVDLAVKGII